MDFNLILNTSVVQFQSWFMENFREVPDKYKNLPCNNEIENNSFLIPHNPHAFENQNNNIVFRYDAAKYSLNPVTNEHYQYDLFFAVIQVKIIPLNKNCVQIICECNKTEMDPITDEIYHLIIRVWKDYEQISPISNNPLDAWKKIPSHGNDQTIAKLFCEGKINREIGKELHLAPKTVTTKISYLRNKYGLPSKEEITRALTSKN